MNREDDHWDPDRVGELFASLDSDAAPPDTQFLARLREHSTEAFAAGFAQKSPPLPARRRRMFVLASRILAAATAVAVMVTVALWSGTSTGDAEEFRGVLATLADASTVELKVTEDGKDTELWAKQPGKLRWNHSDGTYSIARGERAWLVDEKANRASSKPAAYFEADKPGLDLLGLFDLPAKTDREGLLAARPVEQIDRDGTQCDVYRMEVAATGGPIRIEAIVNAKTRMLHTLTATPSKASVPWRVGKIEVVSVGKPVDDSLFVVGDTLTEDGRVGKVTDVQGLVTVKPVMHSRWTPLCTHMPVMPGDWVRTDLRGANAVALRLVKDTLVTLGPGTLVEVVRPNQIRIHQGVAKIVAEENAPVELVGPGDQKIEVKGSVIYRVQAEKLVKLEQPPLWLQGFEGTTANESIGSLVAQVDGRDVPLTVGYHKVSVEIRDQIARTTIEESFVNHLTSGTPLEGQFFFPLPQDASIAGFGMWIGNELVEADVVEKQRAREIYEQILREKRDPGLLEWEGGNIFKARVYPIPAGGEKRIKITYTQVLPLTGRSYRYSYALRSELLKQNPLRELAVDVRVNSAMPLAGISSPTHMARIDSTEHSAHVEFTAQEYTPTRDFEVVVELAGNQSNVVMIPHRRGDDGYFMLQLTPPDGEGQWQRDVLPDGKPLSLLILADTSGSIDAEGREVQAELIGSILASLTADDTVNLACCDVECDWAFEAPVAATEDSIKKMRDMLDARVSLGWTDLDAAFDSALKQIAEGTQVIYVGDGIVTTRDADPVAFAQRLRLLAAGKDVALHAVSVSSSFEPVVMKAIASLGGGSVRQITGERTPEAVAVELLGEISRPTLRDLKVEFRGIRTARVYPEQLPNLPAGTQQIILGRYLPTPGDADQRGEVIVTGTQGGQPVRFSTQVSLKDAEQGNSFIPRLWARMHLDALLAQGSSSVIRDEIIGLSEEYHIMTPYTSFLVLETDADRERFKVERRFQMRDAEKFFAEGRSNVDYDLVQQQMLRAGNWRLGLRNEVLRQLVGLGRDIGISQQEGRGEYNERIRGFEYGKSSRYVTDGGGMYNGRLSFGVFGADVSGGDFYLGDKEGASYLGGLSLNGSELSLSSTIDGPMFAPPGSDLFADEKKEDVFWSASEVAQRKYPEAVATPGPSNQPSGWFQNGLVSGDFDATDIAYDAIDVERYSERALAPASRPVALKVLGTLDSLSNRKMNQRAGGGMGGMGGRGRASTGIVAGYMVRQPGDYWPGRYTSWLGTLFPGLPAAPQEEKPFKPEKPWSDEARALATGLLRSEWLANLKGGLEIERKSEGFDPRWDELTSRSEGVELVSPAAWLIRSGGYGSATTVQWCDEKQRGVLSRAFELGRIRKSTPLDVAKPPVGLAGHLRTSLEQTYQNYTAEVRPAAEGQALLVLTHPTNEKYEIHFLIDTQKKVLLSIEHHSDGKVTSSTKYDELVEVGGVWWAGRSQSFDTDGKRTSVTTEKLTLLEPDAFAAQMQGQLAGRDRVQFLAEPMVTLADAKRAQADGKAGFDAQMTLLLHFCDSQQWDRVLEHLDQAEKLAGEKPGMRWVRDAIYNIARRREELRGRIMDEAARLAGVAPPPSAVTDEYYLASYLTGQAQSVLEANEMLALWAVVKPVYERQPKHLQAMKSWTQNQVNYLRQVNRPDEALALQKQLAEDYPHDYSLQQQYANALSNVGEYDAAFAWLDRVITDEAKWRSYEEDSLRQTYTQMLQNQGRWPDLADYAAAWVKRNPDGNTAYQQYLGALIHTDQVDKAESLMAQWLKEGRQEGKRPQPVASRFDAAVRQALGQGYQTYTNQIDEKWFDPLAQTVRFFARQEDMPYVINQIMSHGQFQQTDQCRQLRREFVGILRRDIETLKPGQIQRLIDWVWPNDPAVEQDVWRRIAEVLEKRWADEANPEVKNQFAGQLIRILSAGKLDAGAHLAFLRRQLAEGPEKYRAGYAQQLFNVLLAQSWSAACEDEAFGLLERLSDNENATERLAVAVQALYQLTDRMVQARYQAEAIKIEHQEELTRTELADKQRENQRLAQVGFAARLEKAREETEGGLKPWFNIERLYLETLLGDDLDAVADECWETLGPKPPAPPAADAEPTLADALNEILRGRCLVTLANLAARKDAKAELIDRLLAYADAGIAQAPPEDNGWKMLKYQLLVALDRPKDLETDLRAWLRADDPLNFWRVSLANLLAEQGLEKLPEAIKLLEAVEADDELGPDEYRNLANWYMCVDRRDDYETALIDALKTSQEYQLSNYLQQQLNPWQRSRGEMPTELDPNVMRVFTALFAKSGSPQGYLDRLREFYRYTRDFRLLAGLPEAVLGHTAGKVYPFLGGMASVFSEIREEATVDQIAEKIAEVRAKAKTPIDRRAIDLLEAIVERRAAELQNQPGPHAEKALAALKRAFRGEWSPGEPRLMAELLAGLGRIATQELAEEQLRELAVLFDEAEVGTLDRLSIGHARATCLWGYDRQDQAIDLLVLVISEYQAAKDGVLPTEANGAIDSLLSFLRSQGHFARGEEFLFAQLEHPANQQQTYWLRQRLYELYENAIGNDGQVSLGRGQELYRAVERQLQTELDTTDQNYRYSLVDRLCNIYRTAQNKSIEGVVDDLRTFASKRLPEVLVMQTNNYQQMVNRVADALHDLAGPAEAVAMLVERIENEPSWFRFNGQDGWNQHGYQLARWRDETVHVTNAKRLDPDVEARLLKIVQAELRRDLESRQQRNRQMYYIHNSYFWKEKEADFARVAEEVYEKRKESGAAVRYIAQYLYDGLDHYDRAIEMLFVAFGEKRLDEGGQSQLVQYLHNRSRYGESIGVLVPLVELRPDNMNYRVWLMHAYFRTNRPAELLALLEETDVYFHEKGRWSEGPMASLAQSCLDNQLYEQSVAYYEELIPLHQRTQANRGIGDGTLSSYYANEARAYAGLKNTAKAVDAACGAIVSWGPTHPNRAQAIQAVRDVLRNAPDLDAYVAELDEQVREDGGRDRPIVRQAIGMVYSEKGQYDKALAQLTLAVGLQPNNTETHEQLVACYDNQGDEDGAIRQLLASVQLSRRDLELYKKLGQRYGALDQPEQQQRAYTTIVEMLPNESESHTMLAEIRQGQNRWDEAIAEWRRVVAIRSLEPTGLLKLAEAQLHQRQWEAFDETIRQIRSRDWPSRFNDVENQVSNLVERQRREKTIEAQEQEREGAPR